MAVLLVYALDSHRELSLAFVTVCSVEQNDVRAPTSALVADHLRVYAFCELGRINATRHGESTPICVLRLCRRSYLRWRGPEILESHHHPHHPFEDLDTKLAPGASAASSSELRWGQRIKTAPVGCAGSSALHRKDENWGIVAVIWLLPQTKLSSLASSRSVNKLLSPLGLRRLFGHCPPALSVCP